MTSPSTESSARPRSAPAPGTSPGGATPDGPAVEIDAAAAPSARREPPAARTKPVTIRTLERIAKAGERFACLTCYDYTTARWLERAGVPLLLVGDTAGEMILGHPGTIHAPLDFLITITAAVKRGAPTSYVMADMPFGSYQVSEEEAVRNAARFLVEGRADGVKLEVDGTDAPLVARLARAGIPVIAHLGCRPQQAKLAGGYRAAATTEAEIERLVEAATAMQDAGASMLLLEAMPAEASARVLERARVPVIGCGAGPACHGQIVVLQDLLGLTDWQPAFAAPMARMGDQLVQAALAWSDRVGRNDLGAHPYRMKDQ